MITGSHGSLGRWETSDSACTARASISSWSLTVLRKSGRKKPRNCGVKSKTEKLTSIKICGIEIGVEIGKTKSM